MIKNLILIAMVGLLFGACSMQRKVSRKYVGEGREVLIQAFGEPQKIVQLEDGGEVFLYIKETMVKQTEIGTGGFTLDPRISPAFVKVEEFRFLIDKNGIIVHSEYLKKNE